MSCPFPSPMNSRNQISSPIIRTRVSMGKLDEGGSRGQCAGLFSLLEDISTTVTQMYGNVIRLSEDMFDVSSLHATSLLVEKEKSEKEAKGDDNDGIDLLSHVEVDLVTAGVWVPIATALMADSKIQMAIFSPGIANILQVSFIQDHIRIPKMCLHVSDFIFFSLCEWHGTKLYNRQITLP